jgi:hypothetical protein
MPNKAIATIDWLIINQLRLWPKDFENIGI